MSATSQVSLLTAEAFARQYAGERVELVQGVVLELPMPYPQHGKVCFRMSLALGMYLNQHDTGHVMTNDSFVRVTTTPESVYGADVLYVSYERLPRGWVPGGLLDFVPELVVEVRSPSDTWTKLFGRVEDYLRTGVTVVVLLDPGSNTASVHRAGLEQLTLRADEELTLPDLLPGFCVRVGSLFE